MRPPVLFLDVDGVLNSVAYYLSRPRQLRSRIAELDPIACQRLHRLLRRTGAVVVLSSAWRKFVSLDEMMSLLRQRGCEATIIAATPELSGYRGVEIEDWLRDNRWVKRFAIVDDDSDMEPYMHRFVKTEHAEGLQPRHVQRLEQLLGRVRR